MTESGDVGRGVRGASLLVVAVVLAALGLQATPAEASTVRATAVMSPLLQYVGDTGSTSILTLTNTGGRGINAVELDAPGVRWTTLSCPSGPAGWRRTKNIKGCVYVSPAGPAGDLAAGVAAQFGIRTKADASAADFTGTWRVIAKAAGPNEAVRAAGQLRVRAYSLEVSRAVVTSAASPVGAACPGANRQAPAGSTRTLVICGKNHTTAPLTVNPSTAALTGDFAHGGTWSSAALSPGQSGVIADLGNATVTTTVAPDRQLVLSLASVTGRQTARRTGFSGYSTSNQAPTASDLAASTEEDTPVDVTLMGSDLAQEALRFSAATPAHGSLGTVGAPTCGAGRCTATVTYTPAADFAGTDSFAYTVTDPHGSTGSAIATLTVNPVNDAPTDLVLSPSAVVENKPVGTTVGALSTTDPDAGNSFTYALVTGTGDADNASFTISGATLNTAAALDFESKSSFTVRVRSTDNGGLFVEKAVTVTASNVNEAPTSISLSNLSVAENQPAGTTVGALSSTDPDAGDGATYSLPAGIGDNSSFAVSGTGLKTAASFDHEGKSSYSVVVRATDSGGLTLDKTFVITVSDVNEAPTSLTLTGSSVAENLPSGTTVGTLSGADPEGDGLAFALVPGALDDAGFQTSGATLKTAAIFDFEAKRTYQVRFSADDGHGHVVTKDVPVSVTDANDAPTGQALTSTHLAENSAIGTVIGTLSDTDQDAGDTGTYSLPSGVGDNSSFTVTGTSLKAAAVFDREATSSYDVTVRVTDAGGATLDTLFTITIDNVNEAPTDLSYAAGTFTDTTPAFSNVGTFLTTDPDAGDTAGYALVSGNGTDDADNGSFQVSGADLQNKTTLPTGTYHVRVRTTDAGGLSFAKALTVTVGSSNAPPVAVNDAATILEDASATVIDVVANDTDAESDPIAVTGVGTSSHGTVSLVSGVVRFTPAANYCNSPPGTSLATFSYTINGGSSATVSVTVTCVDDPPVANDDTTTVTEGASSAAIDVLANDTDVEGDPITVTSISTAASHGTATLSGGVVSYAPAAGYCTSSAPATPLAPDSFSYAVNGGDTATVSVSITCVNSAPTTSAASKTVQANLTTTLSGLAAGTDPDDSTGPSHTASTYTLTSAVLDGATCNGGGTLTNVQANGSLDFSPPAGFTGTCAIDIKVTDSGFPAPGLQSPSAGVVTVTVAGPVVWFADAANGSDSTGTGTFASPFKTLTKIASVDSANQVAYLYPGAYPGAVTLENGEKVIGAGAKEADFATASGLSLPTGTVQPAVGGTNPTVTGSLTLGSGNTLRGVTLTGAPALAGSSFGTLTTGAGANADVAVTSSGQALSLTTGTLAGDFTGVTSSGGTNNLLLSAVGSTGTAFGSGALSGAGGDALSITGGTGVFSYAGTVTSTTGRAVVVAGKTGGSVGLSGAVSSTGNGVSLTGNAGSYVAFTGGLALSSGANSAFVATGGGTVTATQNNTSIVNTLASSGGTALNVTSTTIGAAGLTFRSISAGTGTGSAGDGIVLDTTGTSGGLTVTGNGAAGSGGTIQHKTGADASVAGGIGVYLNATKDVSLSRMQLDDFDNFAIRGTGVTNFTLADSVVSGANGTSTVQREGSVIFDQLLGSGGISNSTISGGVEDNVRAENTSGTLTAFPITGSTIKDNNASTGNVGVRFAAQGTSVMTASVAGSTFFGNRTDAVNADVQDTATLTFSVTGSTFTAGSPNTGNIGIDANSSGGGTANYTVTNNKIGTDGTTEQPLLNHGMNFFAGNTSTLTVSAKNNTIVKDNSGSGTGIRVFQQDSGHVFARIDSNTITKVGLDYGIDVTDNGTNATATTGSVSVAVVNNSASVASGAINGIHLRGRRDTTTCAIVTGNSATTNGGTGMGLSVSQANTAVYKIEGLTSGAQSASTTQTYLAGVNTGTVEALGTGSPFTGVTSGTCTGIPS